MVNITLDKHDVFALIEGCVNGNDGCNDIWNTIITQMIPQMTQDETDYIWHQCRSLLWAKFHDASGNSRNKESDKYDQTMAALHHNRRAFITTNEGKIVTCYWFNGKWHPFATIGTEMPESCIAKVKRVQQTPNKYVSSFHRDWWDGDI